MRRTPGGGPGPAAAAAAGGGGWRWSQTETLVRVSFPVPRGIRKSDVTLAITDNSLRLTLRDFPQPLLDVPLPSPPPISRPPSISGPWSSD
jgi:hypothetical protein